MTTRDGLPTIRTFMGMTFDFLAPTPESITLADIAHALSLECRFANQAKVHYSVAQHSVIVSEVVGRNHPELARIALFHDAAEAYIGDLPKPLKRLLPLYSEIESRIFSAIAIKFNLPEILPPEVKDADRRILANEGVSLMGRDWREADLDPDPELPEIVPIEAKQAELQFVNRYRELFC